MAQDQELQFRPVQPDDLPVICSFPRSAQELFFMFPKAAYPLTPAQLQGAIDQRHDSTVALVNGRLAGFANFYICEPGLRCAIGNVIVSADQRQQGIGRALIKEMLRQGFGVHAVKTVEISCFNLNTAGLLFYPKLGFQPVFIEERVDWTGAKAALIHLALTREDWQKMSSDQSASSR
jgi:RimJ/RimL family protein N-acetyltransferase